MVHAGDDGDFLTYTSGEVSEDAGMMTVRAQLLEALKPFASHTGIKDVKPGDIERAVAAIERANREPEATRPAGHITDLITRLSTWRDRRQGIADSPKREGKPLPNTELDQAIAYLEEHRELVGQGKACCHVRYPKLPGYPRAKVR